MTAELAIALPLAVICLLAWWRVQNALSRWMISLARKDRDDARR